ncbi:MAG: hypothetical protein ACYS47_05020 [Planctomycetota bacterium]|jgi:chromosome segregation ATPase
MREILLVILFFGLVAGCEKTTQLTQAEREKAVEELDREIHEKEKKVKAIENELTYRRSVLEERRKFYESLMSASSDIKAIEEAKRKLDKLDQECNDKNKERKKLVESIKKARKKKAELEAGTK